VSLAGKVAVVTGAGGGIGRATAVELARCGCALFLVDLDEPAVARTATAVADAGGPARAWVADVTDADAVRGYVEAAVAEFGGIDVFVNNAGIESVVADVAEYPIEAFDAVFAVNVRGVFLGLRFVLPVMIARGAGAVVNTASMAGLLGLPHTGPYNASKHAVIGLTKTAAAEVARSGVRVNAVCPGVIETRMTRSLARGFNPADPEAGWQAMADLAPVGRFGTPEEVAAVIRFLADSDSSYVTGASWVVDGGTVATR
jgi:NAD(P)-dependent dehydrogenase (short-subunit alcohol dehydrogenase family)